MLLAVALAYHEGALRASLRAEYGIDLRSPGVGPLDLADLTAYLPPGAALWRSIGGPMAWSDETTALRAVEHRLRVLAWQKTKDGSKGTNSPQPDQPPRYAHEIEAQRTRELTRVEKYLERTRRDRQ